MESATAERGSFDGWLNHFELAREKLGLKSLKGIKKEVALNQITPLKLIGRKYRQPVAPTPSSAPTPTPKTLMPAPARATVRSPAAEGQQQFPPLPNPTSPTSEEDRGWCRAWFSYVDANNDEELSQQEVVEGMVHTLRLENDPQEEEQIARGIDETWFLFEHDGNGSIDKAEFMAPVIGMGEFIRGEILRAQARPRSPLLPAAALAQDGESASGAQAQSRMAAAEAALNAAATARAAAARAAAAEAAATEAAAAAVAALANAADAGGGGGGGQGVDVGGAAAGGMPLPPPPLGGAATTQEGGEEEDPVNAQEAAQIREAMRQSLIISSPPPPPAAEEDDEDHWNL